MPFAFSRSSTGRHLFETTMILPMQQAIQKKLNGLAAVGKIQAVQLVMCPMSGAEEYRYLAKSADPEIWNFISPICHRFKANGASAPVNESIVCSGNPLHLLGASYGAPSRAPFLIAATLPLGEAFDVSAMRNAQQELAPLQVRMQKSAPTGRSEDRLAGAR